MVDKFDETQFFVYNQNNFIFNTCRGGECCVSEVRRRKNESFESLFRRAKKQWQASGKILQAKKIQFFEEIKSKNFRKTKTVKRIQTQKKTAYLQKIGRLPPDEDMYPKKRKR